MALVNQCLESIVGVYSSKRSACVARVVRVRTHTGTLWYVQGGVRYQVIFLKPPPTFSDMSLEIQRQI